MTPDRARGTVVGSYELLERIGSGGMGEVWKARDRLLDRLVALKFLNERSPDRFTLLHEARAASALNHPNIVTIFQIGESGTDSYLAMEFVEGQSLRDHLGRDPDIDDALEISEQIVDGLASAHARGIIHRDLKPENIMIRADGRVKLLDFGLAKHLRLDQDSTSATMAREPSKGGELIGTCSYMSPEQARGHAISPASDVFSLGIVMYELFSRRHPFRHDEVLDTLNAIVREEPPALRPPDAPNHVGAIVNKALKKEPSERYSSAVEVSEPLKEARQLWDNDLTHISTTTRPVRGPVRHMSMWSRVAAGAVLTAILIGGGWSLMQSNDTNAMAPGIHSLAVMPFRTSDQNASILAESLPEDLGSALTKAGFQVASRTSVTQISASPDLRSAAVEMGVDSVLDGNVRVQGSVVRIYVELVNARSGFQLWSATFTADPSALMNGQSDTASQIANEIRAIGGGRQ